MNANHDHITHYSAADIQRYVQGKLSAKEMHAMEKAALDDPFLADAIEGMQQALHDHDESVVTGQLQELQQQIQTRIAGTGKKARVITFHWWQAAAAAVVLIITGVWIYSGITNRPERNTSLAQTEKAEQKTTTAQQNSPAEPLHDNKQLSVTTDSAVAPAEINANATTPEIGTRYKNNKAKAKAKLLTAQASPPNASFNSYSYSPNATNDSLNADLARQSLKTYDVKALENLGVAAAKPVAPEAAARAKKAEHDFGNRETELITIGRQDTVTRFAGVYDKNLSGFVKGQVTDHRNNPIAYAYLQIPNNNKNFMTDYRGFFKIPVKDSVVNIAVNVAGYGTQNFRLQNNAAMNQLQLQPATAALNEVEVTPLSTKKAAALRAATAAHNKLPNAMDQDAQPTFGWVAYEQYLQKNKKVPAGFENITGNVIVSFEVNKKGQLSDFKIEESPAQPFNNEAIRLIKEGPSWMLLKGRKARVTVIVRF